MLGCEMNGSTCDIPPPQTRPPACAEFQGSIQLKWKITGIHQTDATRQPKGLGWDVDCVLKCGKQQEFCYNKVHNKTWILLNLCRLCQALCEYKKDPTNAATYCNKKTTTVSKKNLPTHVQQKKLASPKISVVPTSLANFQALFWAPGVSTYQTVDSTRGYSALPGPSVPLALRRLHNPTTWRATSARRFHGVLKT